MPYIKDEEYRWFNTHFRPRRIFCDSKGLSTFGGETVPYEEWIGVATAVSNSGNSNERRVKNLLRSEFSTGLHRDIDSIKEIDDLNSYEISGNYQLNQEFAEVTLRALERNLNLCSRDDREFIEEVSRDFERLINICEDPQDYKKPQ